MGEALAWQAKTVSPQSAPLRRIHAVKDMFNHRWTRINTDEEMSEPRSGRVFRRSLNGALYVRIETTLFLCVHSCSFVVKLNRYGSAGLAGRHASVARQNRKTPLFFG
jgi:hypothetical protein